MTPSPQSGSTESEVLSTRSLDDGEKIVISGMAGLYPASENIKDLSDILYNQVNPVSPEGLRYKYNHPEVVQFGGSVPGLRNFDAQFFKVHYHLGICMDPMARKLLEQTYQAIYDAGIHPEELSGKKVGVYVGSCFSEAEKTCFYDASARLGLGIAGCSKTMFANRISYWLNAKGPSMSIDEACCSSTAALEQAYLAISRGECVAAIVGGTYLGLHPQSSVHYGRTMNLCSDGKTKSFCEKADGCAKSEGINVLFLQKAKDARRVYAEVLHVKTEFTGLIKEKTGPKYGFYRNFIKSRDFMKNFYEEANVAPQAIEYVEAFGCAVPEVDKVELEAIEDVYCKNKDDTLFVGSIMSNIGYNEAASGISAITKVLLGYHTGELAANLHCTQPKQDVRGLREGRMRVVTEHQRFNRTYTAVNGMSVTGVNSHVLLHGCYKPKDLSVYKTDIPHLVNISARHEEGVQYVIEQLRTQSIDPEQLALLHNIHKTNIPGHLGRGFTILQTDETQMTKCLSEKAAYFDEARRPLWFVYSGMGSQWSGMGTALMRIPIFAAAIERCRKVLEPKGLDIVEIITSQDPKMFDNILHSFVGIAAVQIGLTDILRELGLEPDGLIGHSVGELGCAYGDGCLTAEEMILSAYSRGLVSLQTTLIHGSMAAIGLGYEQIVKLCPPEIDVACHNGPDSSTISGPAEVMRDFVAELTAKGIFAKEVPCSNIAYHSRYISSAGPRLLQYLKEVIKSPKLRSKRWISSSVPEDRWNEEDTQLCSAEYHTNNLLNPVLFEETSKLIPVNAVLIEVAPHGLLQAILKRSLPANCVNIAITRRKHPDNVLMVLEAIGKLYMEGFNPKIEALYPKVQFPVSTGTPFLSHFVKWAHGEQWKLPMYNSVKRISAFSCKHVISVHDAESAYMRGNCIRGNTLYPFAASLMLVWDTFSMTQNAPKKELSVEVKDVHLYSQPILHDRRQLKLSINIHRGTGSFEVFNDESKVITGFININEHKGKDSKLLTLNSNTSQNTKIVYTEKDIYHLLHDKDYFYSEEFKSIKSANEDFTFAEVRWCNNWVTLIDGMLQLNTLQEQHAGVSQPSHIRRITIDVEEHKIATSLRTVLPTELSSLYQYTRCGGILLESIMYEHLPAKNTNKMTLSSLKIAPYFDTCVPKSESLEIYLQMMEDNLNKDTINILGIVSNDSEQSIFNNLSNILRRRLGESKIIYKQITRGQALASFNFPEDVDLLIVQNLSYDDKVCRFFHKHLTRNQFIVNEEELTLGVRLRPSALYRVICSHADVASEAGAHSQLQLLRWGIIQTPSAMTTISVRTEADIAMISSVRAKLSEGHRLLIVTPYPPLPNLRDLIKTWRRDVTRNKIHLVMVSKDDKNNFDIDELANIDLAFNIMDQGTWGSEYMLPVYDRQDLYTDNAKLECPRLGDYDSLNWVEMPEIEKTGVPVKVQYTGISYHDIKKASGALLYEGQTDNSYAMEFSGVTQSGERVMGIVRSGAASGQVNAIPELLWPVPEHWSLEDAATVPLAYALAFYCLTMRYRLYQNMSVYVDGGSGALGQAIISIALSLDCKVFTTVSTNRKKNFLRKIFPQIPEHNIGYSRDPHFEDFILNTTNGVGANCVISATNHQIKNGAQRLCSFGGVVIDLSQLEDCADYAFGMNSLTYARSYLTIDLFAIFRPENIKNLQMIQDLVSEGISSGYVRPLSRVTYAAREAPSAFRLLASRLHPGRVLLQLTDGLATNLETKILCNPAAWHIILGYEEIFTMRFAERLIQRGVKKLCIFNKEVSSAYFQLKKRSWETEGVQVKYLEHLNTDSDVDNLIKNLSGIEGVYVITQKDNASLRCTVSNLDKTTRSCATNLKYFGIIHMGNSSLAQEICRERIRSGLPAVHLSLPEQTTVQNARCTSALNAVERALVETDVIIASDSKDKSKQFLQSFAELIDIPISKEMNHDLALSELGLQKDRIPAILFYLKTEYNIALEEHQIPSLSIATILKFEEASIELPYNDTTDWSTFFNHVDSDELLATTEIVGLPTIVNSASMRDDEFDSNASYLYIVPGLESHFKRFQVLCERLKLPALVIQPGNDTPNESYHETADKMVQALLKRTNMKNNFYLMGYESGIIVALEMAAILESRGLCGTVFCVGTSPNELIEITNEFLNTYRTQDEMEDALICHIFTLMTQQDASDTLRNATSLDQKLDLCVRTLLSRVSHSAQYARTFIEATLARVQRLRTYSCDQQPALRSKLVLLRAAGTREAHLHTLQQRSLQPLAVHQLSAPLGLAAWDLRCAAVINSYLDNTILDEFEKTNICDSYLVNPKSFMSLNND